MRPPRVLLVALLAALLGACNLINIQGPSGGAGPHSDAFVSGFVDAGWTANDDLLDVDLLQDALISIEVWKLVRLELGLVGASVGLGPFDAGLGVLFYQARPPRYRWSLTGDELPGPVAPTLRERHHDREDDDDDDHGHVHHHG